MIKFRAREPFSDWLENLKDERAKAKITAGGGRLALGNPGEVAPIGNGLSELRIHYGPGYRVYFMQRGDELVFILGGGTKRTQAKDIKRAKEIAAEMKD